MSLSVILQYSEPYRSEDTDYADNLALLLHTEDHMQEKTRKLEENARMVSLKINAKKTKLMYLNTERLPVIFVEGKQLDISV
jgi:hypothetical protein